MPFSEALKLNVKRKADFRCCLCHALGIEIHHIIPHEFGGPDVEDNAAPLCPSCHETYGANPTKRKFIREARDVWYELVARRFKSEATRLDRLASLVGRTATKEDLADAVSQILGLLGERGNRPFIRRSEPAEPDVAQDADDDDEDFFEMEPRTEQGILAAEQALFDKVWYNRHMNLLYRIEHGDETISPDVLKVALQAAERVRQQYGEENLGPWDDFEWGMVNGKLSALRWVLGDEWDFLDT